MLTKLLSALDALGTLSGEQTPEPALGSYAADCLEQVDWSKVARGLVVLESALEDAGAFSDQLPGSPLERITARAQTLSATPSDNAWRASTGTAKALACLRIAHRIASRAGVLGPHVPTPDLVSLAASVAALQARIDRLDPPAIATDEPAK